MMHHDTLQSMQVSHAYPSVVTVIPAEHPSRNGMPAASQQGVADKACHRAYVSFLAQNDMAQSDMAQLLGEYSRDIAHLAWSLCLCHLRMHSALSTTPPQHHATVGAGLQQSIRSHNTFNPTTS